MATIRAALFRFPYKNKDKILLLVFSLLFGGMTIFSIIFTSGIILLPFIFIFCIVIYKKPLWVLYSYIVLLPLHSLIMTILIAQLNFPISIIKIIASWKEALLIATLCAIVLRSFLRREKFKITWVDFVTFTWLSLIVFYFIFSDLFPNAPNNLMARLYGLRDWALYLVPFLIGRMILITENNIRQIFKLILAVGVITSLLGILDVLFIPTQFHALIGVPQYYANFLGLHYPDYLMGLPENYWAEFGNIIVRRAVSVYLSGQGFALSFIVIIPVVVLVNFKKLAKQRLLILGACVIGLLVSITRMTILACFIQVLILLFLLKKNELLAVLLALIFLGSGTIILASPKIETYVIRTLTLSDTSSQTRPNQYLDGISQAFDSPFGNGLGSTGQTSARFGGSGQGSEAGYLKILGTFGFFGFLMFSFWFFGIIIYSYWGFKILPGYYGWLSLITLLISVGFLVNNITAPPDQSTFVIYIFPWLAGSTIQAVINRRYITSTSNLQIIVPKKEIFQGNTDIA